MAIRTTRTIRRTTLRTAILAAVTATALLLGGRTSAQSVADPNDASLPVRVHALQELGLDYDLGTLFLTLADAADASFPVVARTLDGSSAAALQAIHPYASLSDVLDAYWNALTALGFEGDVSTPSPTTSVYTFDHGTATLQAVFTMLEHDVAVSLMWV